MTPFISAVLARGLIATRRLVPWSMAISASGMGNGKIATDLTGLTIAISLPRESWTVTSAAAARALEPSKTAMPRVRKPSDGRRRVVAGMDSSSKNDLGIAY
ncbi:hypothetical protein D3C87_1551690 [compost metagenome]